MRPPYGRVNLIGLMMIAAVVGGIYSVVIFAPMYADNMDVSEAIAAAHHQVGKMSDEQLRSMIRDKLYYVGEHKEYDQWGNVQVVQGLGLTDEQIIIERNEVAGIGIIRVEYEREVQLKPSSRIVRLKFKPEKSGPIIR